MLLGLGGGLWVLGAVMPAQLGPVYRGWMGFAKVLSKFTTPSFMGVVYYLVLTPIAAGMRLFGRNRMVHKAENGSYWVDAVGRSDMTHQF